MKFLFQHLSFNQILIIITPSYVDLKIPEYANCVYSFVSATGSDTEKTFRCFLTLRNVLMAIFFLLLNAAKFGFFVVVVGGIELCYWVGFADYGKWRVKKKTGIMVSGKPTNLFVLFLSMEESERDRNNAITIGEYRLQLEELKLL